MQQVAVEPSSNRRVERPSILIKFFVKYLFAATMGKRTQDSQVSISGFVLSNVKKVRVLDREGG